MAYALLIAKVHEELGYFITDRLRSCRAGGDVRHQLARGWDNPYAVSDEIC